VAFTKVLFQNLLGCTEENHSQFSQSANQERLKYEAMNRNVRYSDTSPKSRHIFPQMMSELAGTSVYAICILRNCMSI
jgi:hypothetical protein